MVSVPPVSRAALATALLVTVSELALLFLALSPRRLVVSRSDRPTAAERIAFVVPALPAVPTATLPAAAVRAGASAAAAPVQAAPSRPATVLVVPQDSASTIRTPPPVVRAPASVQSASGSGNSVIGPVLAPRGFNAASPLTRRVIDSALDSLNAKMPALIWARVPTGAERDAAYKEGALAMRLAGRTLLVPADPHLAPGVRLPSFFSRQKPRESVRARTDAARHADSLRAATPRRRPDARTPA
jgi:hypothetical protein